MLQRTLVSIIEDDERREAIGEEWSFFFVFSQLASAAVYVDQNHCKIENKNMP